MDFLSSLSKGGDSKTDKPAAAAATGEAKSSTSDILADAKVVAEAARAPEKCDKVKAAGSAADLLDAASDYGKLDESKGVGKYVDQAEGYLRQYSAPKPAAAAAAGEDKPASTTANHAAAAVAEAEIPSGGAPADHAKEPAEKPAESGGGYGDLMKAAGGFLNK